MKLSFSPGIMPRLSHADYLAADGLNCSGLKELQKSPAHYKYYRENPSEPTPAMILGTALHLAVLEPGRFCDDVAYFDGAKRGKAWDEYKFLHKDKIILSKDDFTNVMDMKMSVLNHPVAGPLIQNAATEQSVFWNAATHGFPCKCRPDIMRPDLGIIADVKTCVDASPDGFSKVCANFAYDMQASFYLAGVNSAQDVHYETFLFCAVEKSAPFLCAVYNAKEIIQSGMNKIRPLIDLYAECISSGEWPGYAEEITDIILPSWSWESPEMRQ